MKAYKPTTMKSFFWKQPYGSLMLHGKIETRVWHTKQRGEILICTSLNPYDGESIENISGVFFIEIFKALQGDNTWNLNGYAIAVGNLVDSKPMVPADDRKAYVTYHRDLWCHIYENVRPIVPFPYKGHLSFREVPKEIIKQIQYT